MRRPLPTEREALEILAARRTRPAPRPAPRVGRALTGLIKELDGRFGQGAGALESRWVEIVGEPLARVSRPQKLTKGRSQNGETRGGVLELRVPGPAALLVQHQAADILQRVNLFLGDGAVERLRIAQGPIKPLVVAAKAAPRASRPTPLSAAEEAELQAEVARAPAGLKDALEALGRAVRSREGGER